MIASRCSLFGILLGALLTASVPAWAHGVETRILTTGAVAVEFRFTDGTAMANVDAVAFAPQQPGEPASVGRTDAEGRFSLFPDRDGDWIVEAHDSDHVVRAVVTVAAHHVTETRRAFPDWLVAVSLVGNVLAAGWLGRRRRATSLSSPAESKP